MPRLLPHASPRLRHRPTEPCIGAAVGHQDDDLMTQPILTGARILVVEDEAIIAFDLQAMLSEAGALVVGPARTLRAAEQFATEVDISAAILDIRLDGKTIFSVARQLADRGIPFAFHTGAAEGHGLDTDWPGAEVLIKPAARATILATLSKLIDRQDQHQAPRS